MDHSDTLEEFSLKVHEVLKCPDHGVILHALRDLAEGKRATLLEGTVVEPLSGLGQQVRGNDPEGNYRKAMTALLSWGVRSFPVQPSHTRPNLWTSMAILDGPKGYNQRLFTDGQYVQGGICVEPTEPAEAGLLVPWLPKPTVIMQPERQPVQPFDEDLQYVVDFLNNDDNARAVVATASRFGWEKLSVDCICLYVDADSTTNLATSVASRNALTIILKAEFRHAGDSMEAAKRLLEPPGLDRLAISERE
ncbi:hypothetical protein VTN77DRAFT_2571 [Rasamsonia byssochlamydoides]|uniref:uncharacterized protein n=1 Tax=Rasamsonia byssochlamydoides TaxID=89139 RepID=UPI003743F754